MTNPHATFGTYSMLPTIQYRDIQLYTMLKHSAIDSVSDSHTATYRNWRHFMWESPDD